MEQSSTKANLVSFTGGKQPPSNVEAEEAVLGGILIDPEAMSRVVDILCSEAFYISHHKLIYQALVSLYNEGEPTDPLLLSNWLHERDLLDKIGGRAKIAILVSTTVSAVNIDALAALVMDKYRSRRLISVGNRITEIGYDESQPIADRTNSAEQAVFEIGNSLRKGQGLEPASEIAVQVWTDLEQGTNPAIATNFYDLNELIGGLYRGCMYVVAAVPGGGKSAFADQLAYDVANLHGLTSAIFSLEMPKKQVLNRFLSAESELPVKRLKARQIQEWEWSQFVAAIANVSRVNLHIDDTPGISATEIVARCRRLKSQYGELGCVVVDYLQLMVGEGSEGTRNLELAAISRRFKLMATELDVPVILISQLNRLLEQRSNKRPMLSDLRDTGALGQDADVVIGLYRDEIYNPDTSDRGRVEVGVIKHRDGELGTIKLVFDGPHTRFRNLAR